MNPVTAISFEGVECEAQAKALAHQLHLGLDPTVIPRLHLTPSHLALLVADFLPLVADFNSAQGLRRKEAGKKQGLIKACKPTKGMRIFDATAGWGRDAALLASFGAEVVMFERQPVMAALLADALLRAEAASAKNLSLVGMDAKAYLKGLTPEDFPDVIYMDPMHPLRQKTALVKKDMQALQQVIGVDEDADELLSLARTHARLRVVVKWPQHLPPLSPPSLSFGGKTVRFDVYLSKT